MVEPVNFQAPKEWTDKWRKIEADFVKEMKEQEPEFVSEARINFLIERCAEYRTRIDMAGFQWDRDVKENTPPMERLTYWYLAEVGKQEKELKRYYNELIVRLWGQEYGEISPETVELARQADIADFCEIDRQNKTLCPWHDDKHPSCYIKNGWAYCFSCGKSGNAIDFIMAKHNLNFTEAVKFITGELKN